MAGRNFRESYFLEKRIYSRKFLPAKISTRENIFPRKYLTLRELCDDTLEVGIVWVVANFLSTQVCGRANEDFIFFHRNILFFGITRSWCHRNSCPINKWNLLSDWLKVAFDLKRLSVNQISLCICVFSTSL